jgi:broad specificity phosphatase PhoE
MGTIQEPDHVTLLRYISHADVVIDPEIPVPQWGLSDLGRSRVEAMLGQPWTSSVTKVVCSAETKSLEAASILAAHLDLEIEVRAETGETDRSSTGYVPHAEHQELAAAYFGDPFVSTRGWERSIDSQQRIVLATADLLEPRVGDTALVGHGGVGALLYCHLAGQQISQTHEQPGQGHYWTYDCDRQTMLHSWLPVDAITS